jgi:hypothetical protein
MLTELPWASRVSFGILKYLNISLPFLGSLSEPGLHLTIVGPVIPLNLTILFSSLRLLILDSIAFDACFSKLVHLFSFHLHHAPSFYMTICYTDSYSELFFNWCPPWVLFPRIAWSLATSPDLECCNESLSIVKTLASNSWSIFLSLSFRAEPP